MANKMMSDMSKNENISAMLDGEMSDAELNLVFKQLRSDQDADAWDTYHLIGDVLRSDDLATPMSPDFLQRFAKEFDAEPVILMPSAHIKSTSEPSMSRGARQYLRSYLAVASATAAAVFAFVFAPQLSHFGQNNFSTQISQGASSNSKVQLVSASSSSESSMVAVADDKSMSNANVASRTADDDASVDMVRDPRIDSYLIAHQRFSPAISNAAQYVTPANSGSTASEK